MTSFLDFLLVHEKSTHITAVGSSAVILLMSNHLNPLNWLHTIRAGDFNVRTDHFMLIQLFPYAFGLAVLKGRTLYWGILAFLIMKLYFLIGQYFITPKVVVNALELQRVQFFLYFFLDWNETRLFAHHWTLPCFSTELIEATLMESIFAFFALHRIYQDSVTQSTE